MLPQELYKNSTNYKNCCHIKEKICVYLAMSHNFISCSITSQQCYMALKDKTWSSETTNWCKLRLDNNVEFRCLLTQSPLCPGKDGLATLTGWAAWPSSRCPFLEARYRLGRCTMPLMPCLTHSLASRTLDVSVLALAWDLQQWKIPQWKLEDPKKQHLRKKGETWSNILWKYISWLGPAPHQPFAIASVNIDVPKHFHPWRERLSLQVSQPTKQIYSKEKNASFEKIYSSHLATLIRSETRTTCDCMCSYQVDLHCLPFKYTPKDQKLHLHRKAPRNAAAQTWRKHPKSGVACVSQGFEAVTSRSAGSDKASQHCSKSEATLRKLHSCFTELVADSWLKRVCASNASAWQRGRGKGAFGGWLQTPSRICCTVRFHWSVSGFSICSWIRRTRCSLGNLAWLTCQQRNKAMRLLRWFQWLVKEWWIILNHSQ